jgi:hypothetical protein
VIKSSRWKDREEKKREGTNPDRKKRNAFAPDSPE